MKALSIGDMQQRQLAILDAIDLFCKEHNLTYILIGGALLGAVREGKMIPWDDDIDIFMPRKDYRQFLKLFKDDNRFRLLDSSPLPFSWPCGLHSCGHRPPSSGRSPAPAPQTPAPVPPRPS